MCPTDPTYKRTGVTYAQLHRALSSLGVSRRLDKNHRPANVYEHPEVGTLIALAAYPERERVLDFHLVALRMMLDNFGIADATVFDAELQKAK
jgi:hypothetical protein